MTVAGRRPPSRWSCSSTLGASRIWSIVGLTTGPPARRQTKARSRRLPARGQVVAVERGGQQLAERHGAAGRVHEERGAARLEQQLPAAAAGQERIAVPGDDGDR